MMKKTPNKRAKLALIRACAAIVLALVLLAVTGFAIADMLRGPAVTPDVTGLESGDYITTNVDMILGYFAEEYNSRDEVTALYAVVPYDGRFAVVILTERYFDSAYTVYDATYEFINGRTAFINDYILVTGTAEELTDETLAMFYDWFGLNKDWMTEAGLITGEVDDFAKCLSGVALRADMTGRLPSIWAWVLSGCAWLFIMYGVIVFLRLSLGKYEPEPLPEETAAPEPEPAPETEPSAETETGIGEQEPERTEGDNSET